MEGRFRHRALEESAKCISVRGLNAKRSRSWTVRAGSRSPSVDRVGLLALRAFRAQGDMVSLESRSAKPQGDDKWDQDSWPVASAGSAA